MKSKTLRISVGPAPSNWGVTRLTSFYREMAQSSADYVHLGETVCPERPCLSPGLVNDICDELGKAGKEVYASSLTLARGGAQQEAFIALAERIGRIEVNSPAFLPLMRRYPAVSGMFLNVCNSTAARIFARHGAERIVLPCELGLDSIRAIAAKSPADVEVVVHGHVPIAVSGTCYTARCLGRAGNRCGRACEDYPDGMTLQAGRRQMFRVEGFHTLSAGTCCLVEYLAHLASAGVHSVRILPQTSGTGRVVRIYRDVIEGHRDCRSALEELRELSSGQLCNGWLAGRAGWIYESPN